jgi:hypothetical protein
MNAVTAMIPAARGAKNQGRDGAAPGGKDSEESDPRNKKKLQRWGNGSPGSAAPPPIVNEVLRASGRPLDPETRAYMEPRFGVTFGQVRVHHDARAAESARAVDAQAYTVGSQIVFGSGRYAPRSSQGRWLIAHELSHTIQQAGRETHSPLVQKKARGDAASEHALEREADAAANAVVHGGKVGSPLAATPSAPPLQRAPNDPSPPNNSSPQNNSGQLNNPTPQNDPNAQNNSAPAASPTGTTPGGGASKLDFEFDAFISGSLGKPFSSYDYPHDLKNQAAFEADVKAVKGTWLEEPGTFKGLNTGPWCYETEKREFGGGSRRVGFKGTINTDDIGSLANKPNAFSHDTSGSTHVRWTHTGNFTSSGETGSLDGPTSASAPVKSSESHADTSATASTVTTKGSCGYPFKVASPDIDYKLVFNLTKNVGGKTAVRFNVENNLFPYYELLINGGSVWTYTPSSSGPGLINLNRSTSFQSGDWYF